VLFEVKEFVKDIQSQLRKGSNTS